MSPERQPGPARLPASTLARLHREAQAERWGLGEADFAVALERALGARHDPEGRDAASLPLADLALARACELGSPAAWQHFVERFRPFLQRAARTIAADDRAALELADSLYADLYGLEERDGRRRSLFAWFHGRSTLHGWLRAVLARRHVDAVRSARRTEPLDERTANELPSAGEPVDGADPERGRYLATLRLVLAAAIAALDPRERLRLSLHYVEELTLAEIGRLLGEHESTTSRKLERSRRALRRQIERSLRREHRLSEDQIRLCFEYGADASSFDLAPLLSGDGAGPGKKSGRERSTLAEETEDRLGRNG